MSAFLTILFLLFMAAVIALLAIFLKIYSVIRKMKKARRHMEEQLNSASRPGRRAYGKHSTRRGRIIPPEYAVDVKYTEETVTGTEEFLRIDGDGAPEYRAAETQISEAEYEIIK